MSVVSRSSIQYSGVRPRFNSSLPAENEEELACLNFNPITFSYRPKIDKALVGLSCLSSLASLVICCACFQSYLFHVEHVDSTGVVTGYNYGWMRRVDGTNGSEKSHYLVTLDGQAGMAGIGFGFGHLVYAILLLYGFCHICIYDPQHPSTHFRCIFALFASFVCGLITTVDVVFPIYLFANLNFHSQRKITPLWGAYVTYLNLLIIWICVAFSYRLWCACEGKRKGSTYDERYDPTAYGITKVHCPQRDDGTGLKGKFRRFSESFSSISRISQFVPVHRHGSVTHSDAHPVEINVGRSNSFDSEKMELTRGVRSLSGISTTDSVGVLKFDHDEFENQFKSARLDSMVSLSHGQLGIPPTIDEAGTRMSSDNGSCYIADWTAEEVAKWLTYMIRLPTFAQTMVDNNIDGRALWNLDEGKLIDLGVHDGTARSTILSAVSHMKKVPDKPDGNATSRTSVNDGEDDNPMKNHESDSEEDSEEVSILDESGVDLSPSSKSSGQNTKNQPVNGRDRVESLTLDL